MAIQAIQGVTAALQGATQQQSTTSAKTTSFADFLGQELDKVNQLSENADSLAQSYAMGGNVSAADLMIAEQQASLGVDMLSQVSSRVQDAYKTMMNMQV